MNPSPDRSEQGLGRQAPSEGERAFARQLASIALLRVQDDQKRVRVEDYIGVLAAMTGEAALLAAQLYDLETSKIAPGSAVFADQINSILSGDSRSIEGAPPDSVVGVLVGELVPETVPIEAFGSLEGLYRHVATNVGKAPWGNVVTTVPEGNRPSILPLRVAFELRPAVEAIETAVGLPVTRRHVLCALALASALQQIVQPGIDVRLQLQLALEVVFGMAKMAPLSRSAFASVASKEPR